MILAALIIASISLGMLIFIGLLLISYAPHIIQTNTRSEILPVINERVKNAETYVRTLAEDLLGKTTLDQKLMIKTPDGKKYTGRTLEEILEKMMNDPESGVTKENVDEVKEWFEKNGPDAPDDEEGEDEDEDTAEG